MSGTVTSGNPLVDQGGLNRLRGSIVIPNFPNLNVTASYLGKAGFSLAFDGNAVTYIPTMVGAVTSPEPYVQITASLNLLRTQNNAALYKAQMETDARIGQITFIPDADTLPDYIIVNGAIQAVRDLVIDGQDAGFVVSLGGYYNINQNLWNLG